MLVCFNSILVRLKDYFLLLNGLGCGCFNSILVRLKDDNVKETLSDDTEFQFHTGSIKRQSLP